MKTETTELSKHGMKGVAEIMDALRMMLRQEPEPTPEQVCASLLACAVTEKGGPARNAAVCVQRALIAAALEDVSKETFLRRMEMSLTKVFADIERSPLYAVLESIRYRPEKGRQL